MIGRTLRWMGLDNLLLTDNSDEIVRAIRHRTANTTMRLTVIGCIVAIAVLRIWFPDLQQVIITLAIVALFMMVTSSFINTYHGIDIAEEQLRDLQSVEPGSTRRAFLSLFLIFYACFALTDYLIDRAAPKEFDLIGTGVQALIWTGIILYRKTKKNKHAMRSS